MRVQYNPESGRFSAGSAHVVTAGEREALEKDKVLGLARKEHRDACLKAANDAMSMFSKTSLENVWNLCEEVWRGGERVSGGVSGFGMGPTSEHLLVERFAKKFPASKDWLMAKLDDPNPYVAAYAFKCLIRVVPNLSHDDLRPDQLSRADEIEHLLGCVVETITLGDFFKEYWNRPACSTEGSS